VNIAIAIVGLAVLILLHEAGHFFVARAVGMNPRRFYLGFPPALVKVRRKGIEYGIGAIPLGGYVKIPGMHRPAASDLDVQFGAALEEQPQLFPKVARVKRALEASNLAGARDDLPALAQALDEATLGPIAARSARRGLAELRDSLSPDAYWRQRTWRRVAVIFAGPGTNIVLAILLPAIAYMIGAPGDLNRFVKHVEAGKPAAKIGLRAGDEIVGVNGRPTPTFDAVSHAIRGSRGDPITVTVIRHGGPLMLGPVRPTKINGRYALGFNPDWTVQNMGVGGALRQSASDNWQATKGTAAFLPRLFSGAGRKDVSSTVGIVDYSSQAVGVNFALFLQILGLISLSLALLNLLPLLPLDGGHILFSLIEGVRGGRAIGREVFERVSAVGIALLMILVFIGLSNDIGRIRRG
jgi:regulator of sigma E protease